MLNMATCNYFSISWSLAFENQLQAAKNPSAAGASRPRRTPVGELTFPQNPSWDIPPAPFPSTPLTNRKMVWAEISEQLVVQIKLVEIRTAG